MLSIFKRSILCMAAVLSGQALAEDSVRYGSMIWHEELPNALFLTGEIKSGDSFEIRRAMRDQEIQVIVTASPGGNLYEGLQIAAIVNDNALATYLPEGLSCESACSMIFFGGESRLVLGELGVHQFYSGADDAAAAGRKDVTTAETQYTTAEIIGIMNQFETPAFVYEKMFSTTDMYYFKGAEKSRLNRNTEDADFLEQAAAIDAFVARNPVRRSPVEVSPSEEVATATTPSVIPDFQRPAVPAVADAMNNTDFFGADLSASGIRNVSLWECSDSCRRNPDCAAFSYVSEKRWCWHKARVENLSYAPGVISGIYRWEQVVPGILDRPFLEISANDLRGFDIFPKGLKNMSLEQCRAACNSTASCVAFTWVIKKNWCFPKYDVGPLIKQTGTISGVHKSQF